MSAEQVLIVGLSARALAQSARRAGMAPVALDAFADLDTAAAAGAHARVPVDADWRFLPDRLLEAAARLAPPPVPLVYGSGFERDPDLLAALAAGRDLLGSAPEAVRRAKDPGAFAELLHGLGLPHPEIRLDPPADPAGWLQKRRGGAGGGHVRPAVTGGSGRGEVYYQRRVAGRAVSVLVAGDGERAVSLAASEQWSEPAPERPFRYGGAAAPADLPADGAVFRAASRAAAASGLRGLGSVDMLVGEDSFFVLELNLRPGAALDAYERAYDHGLLGLHVAACRGRLGGLPAPLRAAAALIVWAPERLVIPTGFRWPTWSADRGAAGTTIPAGGPVCTVLGEAPVAEEARQVAETRAITLLARLRRHAQRAG